MKYEENGTRLEVRGQIIRNSYFVLWISYFVFRTLKNNDQPYHTMIHFFRRIRHQLLSQNKISKYLFYAIGEILLVVIGILLALQINNWDIKKNQQEKIKEYAKLYIQDLESDILMTEINLKMLMNISDKIDSLALSVQNKKIEEISNIDFLCLTFKILYRPYRWNRSTIDQMKNSGSLQYIEDISITKKIGEYDAFTHHLDEDYLNDKAQSENTLNQISHVINSNYSNIKELRKNVLVKINNPLVIGFQYYKEPEYLKAKDYNLKLITNDINDVEKVINGLIRLQAYYDIRSGIEIPQLTKDAEELIKVLKETYLE